MKCFYYCVFCSDNRPWTFDHNSLVERRNHGFFETAYKIIKSRHQGEFPKVVRMNVPQFDFLTELLKQKLQKYSNRAPIEPECRLVITLL